MAQGNETKNVQEAIVQQNGSGDGVSIHINSENAKRLGIEPGDEAVITFDDTDDEVEVNATIEKEFTADVFCSIVRDNEWELVDASEFGGDMFISAAPTEKTRASYDGSVLIGGYTTNNIIVEGKPKLVETVTMYNQMRDVELPDGAWLSVLTKTGIWQRLKASSEHEIGEIPSEETMEQLIKKVDSVTIQPTIGLSSLETTPEEVVFLANQMHRVVEEFEHIKSKVSEDSNT